MEYEIILQSITTVGFPIVCCAALYLQSREQTKVVHEMSLAIQGLANKIEEVLDRIEREK